MTARWRGVVAATLVTAGCSGGPAPVPPVPGSPTNGAATGSGSPRVEPSPITTAGGCADSPLLTSGLPAWTASAQPPNGLPYAISHEGNLVGILFGYPLRAGKDVNNPTDKVLWIAREPTEGADLGLTLRRVDDTGDPVTVSQPANSGPGEIYPSIVEVPTPGCWAVTAEWAGNRATLELAYR